MTGSLSATGLLKHLLTDNGWRVPRRPRQLRLMLADSPDNPDERC